MPEASLPSDWTISHYRVLQRLGAGGMGEVYAGVDETLKRRVALKAVRPEHRLNAAAQARFLREARILSQLDHPHVCRVYDYIAAEDCDWLVLELIDGQSLQQVLKKGLDRASALKIAAQIADVLVATHAAGVVHRDLKPGNVMLTSTGQVKVLDFGLARSIAARDAATVSKAGDMAAPAADDEGLEVTRTAVPHDPDQTAASDPSTFRTRPGGVSGTPMYMSPEQARGEVGTSASDMYAFGLLLQEMFTGHRAYPSTLDYATLIDRVRRADTEPVRGAGSDVAALIERLTSLAPSQRPTAVETRERLQWIHDKPRRRLQRLAVAAVVGAAILGAVKYTIDLRRERTAAVLAREDADRRRGQAEGLIGFMLGDLREKLQQVGRLDVLEDVYAGATKYFASVPADALSTEEISRRSQSLHQIGLVRQQRGNLTAALEAYGESLKLAQEAAAREPSNPEWQFGLGTSHFYMGDALRFQGDLAGALREFSAYRDIAQQMVDRRPDDTRWLLERSYGHANVSAIYEAQGDLQSARRELELAQQVKEDLVRRDPARIEWQQAVATGHNRLGVVLDKIGDVEAALRHHLADLEIRRQLVARAPQDFSLKRSLYAAISFAARAHEDRGLLQPALDEAREAFDVTAAMAAADVRNVDWQRDHAMAESRIGHLLRLAGRLDESKQHMARALAVVRPIAKAASTNLARQRDLASVEIEAGETELRLGNTRPAIAHADAADALLTPLLARKTETEAPRIVAEARLLAGAAAMRAGDAGRARALRESALAQVRALPLEMRDKRTRVIESRALLALDRAADARPLVEQLTSMGYRHPVLIEEWRTKTKGADDGR